MIALHIECRFNKNSLLQCYLLEILPAGNQVLVHCVWISFTAMKRNDFSTNPSFLGAFSYQIPGIFEDDYRALEHPVQQSLYFAGEAYQRYEYGFTHGAYENGHAAAVNITKCMRNEDDCLPDEPVFVGRGDSCSSASSFPSFSLSLFFIEFFILTLISFH